jgi:hypothetical protein
MGTLHGDLSAMQMGQINWCSNPGDCVLSFTAEMTPLSLSLSLSSSMAKETVKKEYHLLCH